MNHNKILEPRTIIPHLSHLQNRQKETKISKPKQPEQTWKSSKYFVKPIVLSGGTTFRLGGTLARAGYWKNIEEGEFIVMDPRLRKR